MLKYFLPIFIYITLSSCLKERLNKYDINAKNGATDTRIDIQEYKVIKDDNGNGIIDVNETAFIQIFLKNEGPVHASEVSCTCIPENTQSIWTGLNNTIQVGGTYTIGPNSNNMLVQQYTTNLGVGYTLIIKAGAVKTTENLKIKLNYNVKNVNGYNNWTSPTTLTRESKLSIPVY